MRVVVNHVADTDRLANIDPGWMVWTTALPSSETYAAIAAHAVAQGWDKSVLVTQDDVKVAESASSAPLVVYDNGMGHVCVRAFRAEPFIWSQLAFIWDKGFQPCRAWQPLVEEYAEVFETLVHLEPVGARGGGHR